MFSVTYFENDLVPGIGIEIYMLGQVSNNYTYCITPHGVCHSTENLKISSHHDMRLIWGNQIFI